MKTSSISSNSGGSDVRSSPLADGMPADPEQVDIFQRLAESPSDGSDQSDGQDAPSGGEIFDSDLPDSDGANESRLAAVSSEPMPDEEEVVSSASSDEEDSEEREIGEANEEDAASGGGSDSGPYELLIGQYAHHDAGLQNETIVTERSVRVERQEAVKELTQLLDAAAVSLLASEDGVRHDRVDMLLSAPPLEGVTVSVYMEAGRMVVEFAASGAVGKWLGAHSRGMSEDLSARLKRPILTRVQSDGQDSNTEAVSGHSDGKGKSHRRVGQTG